jgi:poly-gamma-glutamate capsule biosynthesis protein CapA/YwtB (metallophosphatase superfamily)
MAHISIQRLRSPCLLCLALALAFGALLAVPVFAVQAQGSTPDFSAYPLLFRRAGALADSGDVAQVIMVGDTSLARGVETVTSKYGMNYPLGKVSPWLKAADLAVGNYEGVIASDGIGQQRTDGYRLRAQPGAALALAQAGFNLMSVANNHTVDWGVDALQATVENLNIVGIQTVGAGQNGPSARAPVVTTVNGVRIVWLSFTMVPDSPDNDRDREDTWTRSWFGPTFARDKLAAMVKAARPLGDALIVQFHWGNEYKLCPDDWQVDLARAAIFAGASMVVGHHPHVVQSYEAFGSGFIAYSLGNFLFDQPQGPGLALWVRIDKKGVIDVRGLTLQPGVRPVWDNAAQAAAGLRGLCPMTRSRATSFGYTGGQFSVLPALADLAADGNLRDGQKPCADRNRTRDIGQIDMKGDGEAERITLQSGTLHIYEEDRDVYTSHPSWQVVDASVGDPNQDGRFEVLMLLWKEDAPGAPVTTHPFIVGYRNGQYQVIWGGSATAAWVQAVGVADVDGDHLDELVTVERDAGALPCEDRYRVVVTRWNGWGFVRQWASAYGYFDALAFKPRSEGGEPLAIVARGN